MRWHVATWIVWYLALVLYAGVSFGRVVRASA